MMAASWFKKPDPKEQMRDNDRALRRTNRDLEKDRNQLDRQEKEVEAEIRKLAKQGNRQACATLAKQLINIRKQKTKSYGMSAKVSAVATQTKTMYSSAKMADAMKTTTQTMTTVNKQLNPQQLAKTMQDFEKANMQMDMGDEMINETLDSMLDESGDEEEQDAIVNQVLDEIGIDLNAQLAKAPLASSTIGTPAAAERMTDADVDRMLAGLR